MQLIAAVTRNDTIATACGSFFLLMFISLNGYVLNKNNIPPWWIWGEGDSKWLPPPAVHVSTAPAPAPPASSVPDTPEHLTFLFARSLLGQPLRLHLPRPGNQRVHLEPVDEA